MSIGYEYRVCPFEDGNKFTIAKIEYNGGDIEPSINIDKGRLNEYP